MLDPSNEEVLGSTAGPFRVEAAGSTSFVSFDTLRGRRIGQDLRKAEDAVLHDRVRMRIRSVRGALSIPLSVYIGLPEGSTPENHPEHLVGRIMLFGLRQSGAQGMGFSLDVTEAFKRLQLFDLASDAAIRVDLVPDLPLPPGRAIDVGQVSFVHHVEE